MYFHFLGGIFFKCLMLRIDIPELVHPTWQHFLLKCWLDFWFLQKRLPTLFLIETSKTLDFR